ncbi:50S ribosomal protein L18 [Gracilariopsis chorda]|uniref:50S ribosomal protein L18 n=1 Tax=Gracilariopsis chorda TaxID=448386 RepID=A0A2V3IVI1_9FLOR|nr:50S ribosomal protein L18 [Gracilariopsis chorda]|eukprot:PXF45717.1 50S ribosomal protein L18 [Gracilariopsis chorda]
MARIRVRRPSEKTLLLLLNLTNRHVHAQLVDPKKGVVALAAHTTEPSIRAKIAPNAPPGSYVTASVAAAATIGSIFADRARFAGVSQVYWQSPGRYHGKIKAFVDAVRHGGVRTLSPPSKEMPLVEPLVKDA